MTTNTLFIKNMIYHLINLGDVAVCLWNFRPQLQKLKELCQFEVENSEISCPRCWAKDRSNFSHRIFWKLSLWKSESSHIKAGFDTRILQTTDRIQSTSQKSDQKILIVTSHDFQRLPPVLEQYCFTGQPSVLLARL